MLYLAEVIKKRFPFGSKAELKLLAYQNSAENWEVLQNGEIILAEEVNRFSHGSLVFVRLNNSRQIQQIENQTGQKLAQILRQFSLRFSRLRDKYQAEEEEIEQWKQSLTWARKRIATGQHGAVIHFLAYQLEEALAEDEKPWVVISGLVGVCVPHMPLWDSFRVPSITVLPFTQWKALREREAKITLDEAPPILVVEVVSDYNKAENYDDLDLEKSAWALLKIPEYWIVDLLQNKITLCILEEQTYKVSTYQGDELVQSSIMPSLHLSVSQIMSV
jgi:Uma2 family endonuclease